MYSFLLENPLELGWTLGIVMVCVLLGWAMSRKRAWMHMTLGALGLCGVLMTVNLLVQTEREQVQGLLRSMVHDVEAKRLPAALTYVDKRYNNKRVRFRQIQRAAKRFKSWKFKNLQFTLHKTKRLDNGEYSVLFSCVGEVEAYGVKRDFERNFWVFRVKKSKKAKHGWLISRIEPLQLSLPNRAEPKDLRQVLRMRI